MFSILAGEESPGEQVFNDNSRKIKTSDSPNNQSDALFSWSPMPFGICSSSIEWVSSFWLLSLNLCFLIILFRKTKEFEGLEAYPPVIQFDLPEPVHIYHFSRAVEMVVEEEERGKNRDRYEQPNILLNLTMDTPGKKHNESWEKKRKQEDPNNSPFLIPPCRLHAINKPYQTSYSTSSSSSPPPPPSPTFSTSSPCPSLTAGQFRTVAVEVEACVLQRGFNMFFFFFFFFFFFY